MKGKKMPTDEFMAAAIGDLSWLKQCLKENKKEKRDDIQFDKNGLAAIHLASIHGRLECLKYLIDEQKLDVNQPSKNGWRPIHLCISNQTGKRAYQCLTYLLEKNANPSITNEDGITPAHQAASEGHFDCLKLLLEVDAEITAKDSRGNQPIDLAKLWGHRRCARMLANEMWHREKDNVAKEMRQLKKERMREVLDELDRFEQIAEDKKFYGGQAFNEWLTAKNEQKKGTASLDDEKDDKQKSAVASAKRRLANKGLPSGDTQPITQEDTPRKPSGGTRRVVEARREHLSSAGTSKGGQSNLTDEEKAKLITPSQDVRKLPEDSKSFVIPKREPWKPMIHPTIWNTSIHVQECFHDYLPNLRDLYPRDIYTLKPKIDSSPAELNPLTKDPIGILAGERDIKLVMEAGKSRKHPEKETKPKNKKIIHCKSNPDAFREMMYRTKYVIDAQKRAKSTEVDPPRSEMPLHLCSDIKSILYKNALQDPVRAEISSRTSSAQETGQFDYLLVDETPVNITGKPLYFPTIRNPEYILRSLSASP